MEYWKFYIPCTLLISCNCSVFINHIEVMREVSVCTMQKFSFEAAGFSFNLYAVMRVLPPPPAIAAVKEAEFVVRIPAAICDPFTEIFGFS